MTQKHIEKFMLWWLSVMGFVLFLLFIKMIKALN